MKKSLILLFAFLSISSVLFTGCENFLGGSGLKQDIEDIIQFQSQSNPLKITSMSPVFSNAGVNRDMPVVINFNKPVNPDTFKFSAKSSGGSDFTENYSSIQFYDSFKTVKLSGNFPPEFTGSYCDVIFTVYKELEGSDGIKFALEDYSWAYRLNNKTDSEAPEIITFNVAKTKEDALQGNNLLSEMGYEYWNYDNLDVVEKNVTSDVWVYAKVYDPVSGANFVRYILNPVQDVEGKIYTGEKFTNGFYSDFNAVDNEEGYYETLFQVDFNELALITHSNFKDSCSVYTLDFIAFDKTDNAADIITRSIIYDKRNPETCSLKILSGAAPFTSVKGDTGDYNFYILDDLYDKWLYLDGVYTGNTDIQHLNIQFKNKQGKILDGVKFSYIDSKEFFKPGAYYLIGNTIADFDEECMEFLREEDLYGLKDHDGCNSLNNYLIASGALKVTLPGINVLDGAEVTMVVKDLSGNEVEIPVIIPGCPVYLGEIKREYYFGYIPSITSGLIPSVEFEKYGFNINSLVRYDIDRGNFYRFHWEDSYKIGANLSEPDDTKDSKESFTDIIQFAVKEISDDSYICLAGNNFKKEKMLASGGAASDITIKNVKVTESKRNSKVISLHVEKNQKSDSYSVIKVYSRQRGSSPVEQYYFTDDFSVVADGKTFYAFSILQSDEKGQFTENKYEENGKTNIAYIDNGEQEYVENTYLSGASSASFDVVDNTPPVIERYCQSNFFNDLEFGLWQKNEDDAPLIDEENGGILYEYWYGELPDAYNSFYEFMTEEEIIEERGNMSVVMPLYFPKGEIVETPISEFEFEKRYELFIRTFDSHENWALYHRPVNFAYAEKSDISLEKNGMNYTWIENFDLPAGLNVPVSGNKKLFCNTYKWINEELYGASYKTENNGRTVKTHFTVDSDDCYFGRIEYVLDESSYGSNQKDYRTVSYKYMDNGYKAFNLNKAVTPDFFIGNNGNKIQVVTNQPVFIHTLSAEKDYGSDIQKWERYGSESAPEIVIPSQFEKDEYLSYTVAGVEKDEYYIVIGYAADGTVLKIDSRIKE
ncbi:MAG: hypothetical protein MJ162_04130 [Treponema sp.]|nr:hypothetical protein [Treponema sp.]